MENIRAFGIVQNLGKISGPSPPFPKTSTPIRAGEQIKNNGLLRIIRTHENPDVIRALMNETLFVKSYSVISVEVMRRTPNRPSGRPPAAARTPGTRRCGRTLPFQKKRWSKRFPNRISSA
jgi:hypothetical protein